MFKSTPTGSSSSTSAWVGSNWTGSGSTLAERMQAAGQSALAAGSPSAASRCTATTRSVSTPSDAGSTLSASAKRVGDWLATVQSVKAHQDDLHSLLLHPTASDSWLFSAGKDGAVCALRTCDMRSGKSPQEVLAARRGTRGDGKRVPIWVTAMALHPDRQEVAVGYRDGWVQICDISNPKAWKELQAIKSSDQAGKVEAQDNCARVWSLCYTPASQNSSHEPALLVGLAGRVKIYPKPTTAEKCSFLKVGLQDRVMSLSFLEDGRLVALVGESLRFYVCHSEDNQWEKSAVWKVPTCEIESKAKQIYRRLASWPEIEAAQPGGPALLVRPGELKAHLAVSLHSGGVALYDLPNETANASSSSSSHQPEGAQKLEPVERPKGANQSLSGGHTTRTVSQVSAWVLNDYGAKGDGPHGQNTASRRCWDVVDIGHHTLAVGTDGSGVVLLDVLKQTRLTLPLPQVARCASLVWDAASSTLYTHTAPTQRDDPHSLPPRLLAIQLDYQPAPPLGASVPTQPT